MDLGSAYSGELPFIYQFTPSKFYDLQNAVVVPAQSIIPLGGYCS